MTSSDTFSPNSRIDAAIREMLPHFRETSQGRMKKAIRDAARAAAKHRDENTDAEPDTCSASSSPPTC